MTRLSRVAACTVVLVSITALPAGAVTGSWVDQVLTIAADPDDGDVRFLVQEDPYGSITYVTTFPDAAVSGCEHVAGPQDPYSRCPDVPEKLVLDGGAGSSEISVYFETDLVADIVTGSEGGSVDATLSSATVTGRAGPDVVTVAATDFHAELHAGDDRVAWTSSGGGGLVLLGVGDDAFLVSPTAGTSAATFRPVTVQGGAGRDELTSAGLTMRAYGGPGDDYFQPDTPYYDWFDDSEASPVMRRDVIDGGPGVDTVLLANRSRSKPVRVTLDGRADDGEPGEKDNYGSDVENVVVRFVRAVVRGNRLDNRIELLAGGTAYGADGDDVLVGGFRQFGGPGHDVLLAGPGTKEVRTVDGVRDDVRCASRRTVVHADRLDRVAAACRHVVRS